MKTIFVSFNIQMREFYDWKNEEISSEQKVLSHVLNRIQVNSATSQ